MFNITIVGCKKTLVEYREWVNRNNYYLRNPIRIGGLFSQNDFVPRLTRPEYFPFATSPQNPHHTAIPLPLIKTIHLSNPTHPHFPTPNSPTNSLSTSTLNQNLPIFPNLTHTLSLSHAFIYTFSKNSPFSP